VRTAIVVGAGGSLSQATSLRPKRPKDQPPLDADFFPKAQLLARGNPNINAHLKALVDLLTQTGLFYDPLAPVPAPMEQFFADVYYDVAGQRQATSYDIFVRLIRLYTWVLAATTNWMSLRTDAGSLDRLLRREISDSAPDRPIVITFNQDLIIENVIERIPHRHGGWCLQALYGEATLSRLFAPADNKVFRHHDDSCPHKPPIDLLKLHGSLNWGLRSITADPQRSTLFPQGSSRAVYVDNRRTIVPGVGMRTRTKRGRKNWHLWPLIVPPIYNKQPILGMRVLQTIWDSALQAIAKADRLVLVGYSLPDADVLARQMLRRAYAENRQLTSVEVVNPDPGVAVKLRRVLGCEVIHLYSDLDGYLQRPA
jgi:hypothetical protein